MRGSCVDADWLAAHPMLLYPVKRKKMAGYPALPGTGPKGETCGSCQNLCRKECSKTYFKCVIARAHWTGGAGTDVRFRSPSCSYWVPKMEREKMPNTP